jgi:membrane fusion protein (multidrug efflux system)
MRKIVYAVFLSGFFSVVSIAGPKMPVVRSTAIPVVLAPVSQAALSSGTQTIGTITDPKMATLSAADAGHVVDIAFSNGETVKKNELLIQLDDSLQKAQLANAKAKLSASKQAYQRSLQLSQGKVEGLGVSPLGQQDLVDYESTYLQDKAMVDQMDATLAKRAVLAPFSGKTGAVKVSIGDYVTAGQPLVTLVNDEDLQISFSVPEDQISQLEIGQTIHFSTPLFPHQLFSATIVFMAPAVDADTRTLACLATIEKMSEKLRPGLFVQVDFPTRSNHDVVEIPEQALVSDYPNYVVYRVVDNKAVKTPVVIGQRVNGQVLIQKGLTVGEQVVIAGQSNLSDGQAVQISKQ